MQRYQNIILSDAQSLICLAENFEVYGIQSKLSKNTCQNSGNTHYRVHEACHKTGEHTGKNRGGHCNGNAVAVDNHHNADRTARTDRAVNREVGDIKDLIGNIHTDRHNSPDKSLGYGTGHTVQYVQ